MQLVATCKTTMFCYRDSIDYSIFCELSSYEARVMIIVFSATFNNISVISWRSILLAEETECPD